MMCNGVREVAHSSRRLGGFTLLHKAEAESDHPRVGIKRKTLKL